jgi:hypothetical protein
MAAPQALRFEGYDIRLIALTPRPKAGATIPEQQYVAELLTRGPQRVLPTVAPVQPQASDLTRTWSRAITGCSSTRASRLGSCRPFRSVGRPAKVRLAGGARRTRSLVVVSPLLRSHLLDPLIRP